MDQDNDTKRPINPQTTAVDLVRAAALFMHEAMQAYRRERPTEAEAIAFMTQLEVHVVGITTAAPRAVLVSVHSGESAELLEVVLRAKVAN